MMDLFIPNSVSLVNKIHIVDKPNHTFFDYEARILTRKVPL